MQEERKELKVTTITDLEQYKNGNIVELPPFAEDQPFVARLRRPSMLAMCKKGQIPNSLLSSANRLFADGSRGFVKENENEMREMFELFDTICEAVFVEPTYQQLKEAEIQLTDDQYMFVFNYVQHGTKALDSFR